MGLTAPSTSAASPAVGPITTYDLVATGYNTAITLSSAHSESASRSDPRLRAPVGASWPTSVSSSVVTVATNTGTRLRSGLAQPGVTRTLESSLNPDAHISDVVSHYEINLRESGQSISVHFNPNLASAGRVRAASPNVIEVGPAAFASSEEMARTLAHELNHARSFLRGGAAPESTTYGAEGYLWNELRTSGSGDG